MFNYHIHERNLCIEELLPASGSNLAPLESSFDTSLFLQLLVSSRERSRSSLTMCRYLCGRFYVCRQAAAFPFLSLSLSPPPHTHTYPPTRFLPLITTRNVDNTPETQSHIQPLNA